MTRGSRSSPEAPHTTFIVLDSPVARRLEAPNLAVASQGIAGLAFLGRNDLTDALIRAVRRFPSSMQPQNALPLLLLDDPRAQRFVRGLLPDGAVRESYLDNFRRTMPTTSP